MKTKTQFTHKVAAVDLFCGVGGLTHGMVRAGIPVMAGIDLDPACRYPFESNNKATFMHKDITDVSSEELLSVYPKDTTRILVGCAPCQRFSRYSRRQHQTTDEKWAMLGHFSRLVEGVRPTVVSMENVPELTNHDVFARFTQSLRTYGYSVNYKNVFCPDYGIPQLRTRLVLIASLLGEVNLLPPTHKPKKYKTVKQVIGKTSPLVAGGIDPKDRLHRACNLSKLNLERVRVSRAGGSWREWPEHLIADCHKVKSGVNYPSVYGRMEWGKPAPTITTQFFGYGNGRFGHPEQDRAISLREGSLIQTFPKSYRFCPEEVEVSFSTLGRLIGNAVPVRLGEIIGKSIIKHIGESHV
jgi:DNA (cytosine-5)-methyltransferase 1